MPGPKMGPRPADFDEDVVRQSPTYQKWLSMKEGERLRYACRDFIKGQGDDQERLMRRIMIARRNNLRDHENLKRARALVSNTTSSATSGLEEDDGANCGLTLAAAEEGAANNNNVKEEPMDQERDESTIAKGPANKKRKSSNTSPSSSTVSTDEQVIQEIDVAAVEGTRSYKAWQALPDGKEFIYNQKYIKGSKTHDWLLRKNIWRRMRYRRENKKMVQAVLQQQQQQQDASDGPSCIVDDALLASAAAAVDKVQHIHKAVVDAAVAAAESYVKSVDPTSEGGSLAGTTITTTMMGKNSVEL